MRSPICKLTSLLFIAYAMIFAGAAPAQWQTEWERVQAAARKEGKLVEYSTERRAKSCA